MQSPSIASRFAPRDRSRLRARDMRARWSGRHSPGSSMPSSLMARPPLMEKGPGEEIAKGPDDEHDRKSHMKSHEHGEAGPQH
jgi:hypothetical protein